MVTNLRLELKLIHLEVSVVDRLQPAPAVDNIAELSKKTIEDRTHSCEF